MGWGLVLGVLAGGDSEGFDFDYPAKIHFLLVMTGWCILEITASLPDSPRVIRPQWSDVSLEITPGEMRRDLQLYMPSLGRLTVATHRSPAPPRGSWMTLESRWCWVTLQASLIFSVCKGGACTKCYSISVWITVPHSVPGAQECPRLS